MTDPTRRVMVFIDGGYAVQAAKYMGLDCERVDWRGFSERLGRGRRFIRSYFYYAWPDSLSTEETKFRDWLHELSYVTLRDGQLVGKGEAKRQKGVDVRMALDMVLLALRGAYDVAVVVSGDADLVEAVEEVKREGKHVELGYFSVPVAGVAGALRNACDMHDEVSSWVRECVIQRG